MLWQGLKNSEWKASIVSGACILAAGVGGYFLYVDVNAIGQSGQGKPLANIEQKEFKVRRKSASKFSWNNVQIHESLYRKDSIQTGHSSAAAIRMANGSLLDVGEDSLVIIDDTKDLALSFLRGTVVVHSAEGDSKISVGKDGKTQIEELSARLIDPEPLMKYYVLANEIRKVKFSWELKSKTVLESPKIQVSSSKQFPEKETIDYNLSNNKQKAIELNLAAGKYYWRLLSNGQPVTESRQFKILIANPLKSIWPGQAEEIHLTGLENSIRFRWVVPSRGEAEGASADHVLEIAKDRNFKTIVQSESVQPSLGYAVLQNLPDGMIFWRIKSSYDDKIATSEPRYFSLTQELALPSSDSSPRPGSQPSSIPLSGPSSGPSDGSTSPNARPSPLAPLQLPAPSGAKPESGFYFALLRSKIPVEASWQEVKGADRYEITVYQELDPSKPKVVALQTRIGKTQLSLKELKPGVYFWTVRAIDSSGVFGEPLELRKFIVRYGEVLAAPKVLSSEVQ